MVNRKESDAKRSYKKQFVANHKQSRYMDTSKLRHSDIKEARIIMKKLISLLLCIIIIFSLSVPAFAHEIDSEPLPPVAEGEIWVPANGIMPLEEANEACGLTGHIPPRGYNYTGYYKGDSSIEVDIASGTLTVLCLIPGMGYVTSVFAVMLLGITIDEYLSYGQRLSTYYRYTWRNDDGDYWYHIVWVSDIDGDGYDEYLTCRVETV